MHNYNLPLSEIHLKKTGNTQNLKVIIICIFIKIMCGQNYKEQFNYDYHQLESPRKY